MIVPGKVSLLHLLSYVGRPLALLFAWDVVVTALWLGTSYKWEFPALPLSLIGSAIAVYLSFRNSTAYARWWEARTLWGAMVNSSRTLAREIDILLPPDHDALKPALAMRHAAYVHALRLHLRGEPPWDELAARLPATEIEHLRHVSNVPNAILTQTSRLLSAALQADSIRLTAIERTLGDVTNAQGGMERIRNTPLPQQYATFPMWFTHAFCILLPLGLVESLGMYTPLGSTVAGFLFLALLQNGNDMQAPFANTEDAIPLMALTRTIEIDLRDAMGDRDGLAPLKPADGVLW